MQSKRSRKVDRTLEDLDREVQRLQQRKEKLHKIVRKTPRQRIEYAGIHNRINIVERKRQSLEEASQTHDRSSTSVPAMPLKIEEPESGHEIAHSPDHTSPRDLKRLQSTEESDSEGVMEDVDVPEPEIQLDNPSEARGPEEVREIETTTILFDFQGFQIKERVSLDFMMFVVFQGVGLKNLGPDGTVEPPTTKTLVKFEGTREEAISRELAYYLHRNGIHFEHLNAKGNMK